MKTVAILLTALCMAFGTTAYSQKTYSSGGFFNKKVKASKNYVTKDIRVDNFNRVCVSSGINVSFTQKAGKPKVKVYTSDNIVDLLNIRVRDKKLEIGFKKGVNVTYNKLDITLSAETLNGIAIAGSGDFKLTNGLKTDNLNISVSGSGDVYADNLKCSNLKTSIAGSGNIQSNGIECASIESSISGSGDTKLENINASAGVKSSIAGSGTFILSGKAHEANYSIAGSGDILAADLQAARVNTSIAGSGDIKCHATDFLKVRNSGSGSVGYKGNPELDIPKKGLYKL